MPIVLLIFFFSLLAVPRHAPTISEGVSSDVVFFSAQTLSLPSARFAPVSKPSIFDAWWMPSFPTRLKREAVRIFSENYSLNAQKVREVSRALAGAYREKHGNMLRLVSEGTTLALKDAAGNWQFFDRDGRWLMSIDSFGQKTDELTWNDLDGSFIRGWTLTPDGQRVELSATSTGSLALKEISERNVTAQDALKRVIVRLVSSEHS